MPKQVEITPEVREVLTAGAWQLDTFYLPPGQLERSLYTAVDKVLRALGGRWDRKARGHRFAADAREAMIAALESGVAVDQKRTAEQFFTPPEVAALVFERAELEHDLHVLEPSAGAGALLVDPIRLNCSLTVIEQDAALCADLEKLVAGSDAVVACADFLTWEPEWLVLPDRVVMNPPFGRGQDMVHVLKALEYLRPGGILVAVMSPHWTFAGSNAVAAFKGTINDHSHTWEPLPEGSFKSAGTGVSTGILTIRKGNI